MSLFASGPSYDKLKTNLRLCISRFKLGQKKKSELSQKSRKDIADYLAMGKADRARIRVEHIIREDYYMEAMEMMEMYCDLLLARFGLLKEMNTLDPGLAESVSSIIWAGLRMVTDVPELKLVCDQLGKKYGELYVKGVREGSIETVNAKLMHRLSAEPPPRNLVESYLAEIAAAHGIKYEPQVVNDDKPGNGGIGELIDMGEGVGPAAGFRPDLMGPSQGSHPAKIAPAFEPPMPEVQPGEPPAHRVPRGPPICRAARPPLSHRTPQSRSTMTKRTIRTPRPPPRAPSERTYRRLRTTPQPWEGMASRRTFRRSPISLTCRTLTPVPREVGELEGLVPLGVMWTLTSSPDASRTSNVESETSRDQQLPTTKVSQITDNGLHMILGLAVTRRSRLLIANK